MTHVSSKEIGVVSVSPTTNGATVRSGLHRAARVIADAFTSAVLDSTTSAIASARSAVFDWATIGLDQGQRTASVDAHPTTTRQPATASGINPKRLSRNPKASILDENSPAKSGELRGSARRRRTHKSVHRLRPQWPGGRAAVSPAQMLAVWSYERPRLRRAFKVCYALWFAALWATAAAPTAAAWPDPQLPDGEFSDTAGGLRDIYGVPISAYRVSTVGPLEAASIAAGHQLHGLSLFNPESWVKALVAAGSMGTKNIMVSGILDVECAILIVVAGAGIWFLQFTISASWLPWLAASAQPVVSTLQAMVNHYLVTSFALLACISYGGYIYLARGKGHGLGIIASGLGIIALVHWLFADPIQEMLGPNGVMSIGQHLGFEVAEGAINNGALISGTADGGITALTSLLCTALLRDQIQMVNYGTVVDTIPGCASLWSAAIMSGQQDGPVTAMASCDAAALAHAQQLGMGSAGLFAVVIFVMFWITLVLLWVGFHVVLNGFKGFWRLLVLVVALPASVAPGAPRRVGKHQVAMAFRDCLEFFGSITGLTVIAIMDGSVLDSAPPGSSGALSSPLGRELWVLLITVAGAVGLHRMFNELRNGPGFWAGIHRAEDWLVHRHIRQVAQDFFAVSLLGSSVSGKVRRRHISDPYQDPTPGDLDYREHQQWNHQMPPGRTPPQPAPTNNPHTSNDYYSGSDVGGRGGHSGDADEEPVGLVRGDHRVDRPPDRADGLGHGGGSFDSLGRTASIADGQEQDTEARADGPRHGGGSSIDEVGSAGGGVAGHQPSQGPYSPVALNRDRPSNQQPLPPDPAPEGHFEPPANPPGKLQPPPGQ
jgi:hypothetical protein